MIMFMVVMLIMIAMLLFNSSLAKAITQQEISEVKGMIDSKVDCKGLYDSQLEKIGEYEMELMHPGESHELMHQMMGLKEGSEDEKQFHINMAKTMYCGENGMMIMPMMGMMRGGNNWYGDGYGMMGNFGYNYFGFWNVIWLLFWFGIVVLILWLIYKFVIKQEVVESPEEILKKRYSKGEITEKQFKYMKKEIGE